jgi:hypothetical protein
MVSPTAQRLEVAQREKRETLRSAPPLFFGHSDYFLFSLFARQCHSLGSIRSWGISDEMSLAVTDFLKVDT